MGSRSPNSPTGYFAAGREGYGKAKAVCGLIARPMDDIFFFFLNHITARYTNEVRIENVVLKTRYCNLKRIQSK
jgi:hypothetical protein